MLSQRLEEIFNSAILTANELRHEYLTMETMLLALLEDKKVLEIINQCGGNAEQLAKDLEDFLSDDSHFSILTEKQVKELAKDQFANEDLKEFAKEIGIKYQPEISMGLQRVIQRAALHIQSAGKKEIKALNVLVAMFSEKESYAIYLLEKQGIYRLNVIEYISHGMDKPMTDAETGRPKSIPGSQEVGDDQGKDPLEEYCTNLNTLVKKGKIDPIIGREEEIQRIVQILCRRRKNNPLLVGESGVGKTAIAEGLALCIEDKTVPEAIQNAEVYRLDMGSLLAGTKFRGDFEERLKSVINGIHKKIDEGKLAILYIDEIHTIIGAGATSGGSMDASNLLKPALANGDIRCMGSTTYAEFRKFFEKDQALTRRFQKVEVNEPSLVDAIKILEGLKEKFEEHHGVKYSTNVLKNAVNLSAKYISDRKLPDKAIDVIDEAGAYVQLLPKKRANVTVKDIEHIVSIMAKIPKKSVNSSEKEKLRNLERDLKLLIYGQDEAIEQVSNAIMLSRSGLASEERPIANFLFAGPTGVGKTELAKQLANIMGISFLRFDMSEYMEKHSVSKLIGAPPGYVGFDQGGVLTDAINKTPHSVLLLDEIEKAHPDIYNILLQVMDHGSLADSNGRNTDFKNVILILTTNAGAKEMDEGSIGLSQGFQKRDGKRDKAIRNFFTPEFRNRLNAIIHFNKLSDDNIGMIVDKFLLELEEQLTEKKVKLDVSVDAREWLGKEGYDSKLGARPLARIVDEQVKKVLAKEILFGQLSNGGKVKIAIKDDKLDFQFTSK